MRSLEALANMDGRVVLITGGAGHLGMAMGEALNEPKQPRGLPQAVDE